MKKKLPGIAEIEKMQEKISYDHIQGTTGIHKCHSYSEESTSSRCASNRVINLTSFDETINNNVCYELINRKDVE